MLISIQIDKNLYSVHFASRCDLGTTELIEIAVVLINILSENRYLINVSYKFVIVVLWNRLINLRSLKYKYCALTAL